MRKFRSLETGAILVPNNKEVIKQLENSKFYEEIKTKSKDNIKQTKSKDNENINDLTQTVE